MGVLKELLSNSSTDISFSETVINSESSLDEMDKTVFVSLHKVMCPNIDLVP